MSGFRLYQNRGREPDCTRKIFHSHFVGVMQWTKARGGRVPKATTGTSNLLQIVLPLFHFRVRLTSPCFPEKVLSVSITGVGEGMEINMVLFALVYGVFFSLRFFFSQGITRH